MSKPFVLARENEEASSSNGLRIVDRFESAADLRAALKEADPGKYHALRFISHGEGIVVREVNDRQVTMGIGPEPTPRKAKTASE